MFPTRSSAKSNTKGATTAVILDSFEIDPAQTTACPPLSHRLVISTGNSSGDVSMGNLDHARFDLCKIEQVINQRASFNFLPPLPACMDSVQWMANGNSLECDDADNTAKNGVINVLQIRVGHSLAETPTWYINTLPRSDCWRSGLTGLVTNSL
eukprot:scaffold481554_cov63-Attheya_sp.AAC.1